MFKRNILTFTFGLLLLISLMGCSGSGEVTNTMDSATISTNDVGAMNSGYSNSITSNQSKVATEQDLGASESPVATPTTPPVDQKPVASHKIIQTGEITMESLKFDDSVTKTINYVTSIGGYTESSNVQGQGIDYKNNARKRTANFTFRVPSTKYTDFFTQMKGYGTVTSEQSRGEDITERYLDTEARLKSLKIQEERELALLQKATKLSDILELEKELNSVRYQIESYTGTLRKWDSLVDYSTIRLTVREVEEPKTVVPQKTQGLWARMVYSFTDSTKGLIDSVEDLIVLCAGLIPLVITLGLLLTLVLFTRKWLKRRKNH